MKEKDKLPTPLDFARIRGDLAGLKGHHYWRSLEELAETDDFKQFLYREFPENASEWSDPVGRRHFLQLMGASLALAGISACTVQPVENIVPYVKQPEEIVPGRPLYFATAMPQNGVAHPILVESHMGRPTKIEGNPEHPASQGATNVFAQASVLTLYDPDRSTVVRRTGQISTWQSLRLETGGILEAQRTRRGEGLRVLTETITSPSLGRQLERFLADFPAARWHQWEPASRDSAREGTRLAFGRTLQPRYRVDRADVILSLDADFLYSDPGSVAYARQFAERRKSGQAGGRMNRLYVVEPSPSITGGMADHRLPLTSADVQTFAGTVAEKLGAGSTGMPYDHHPDWLNALVADLQQHRGAGLVIAGDSQPASVHALAHSINSALGNVGTTVEYIDPIEVSPVNQMESLQDLTQAMDAGEVEILLILGGNPVYNAPTDFKFAERMSGVNLRIHLGLYDDETSQLCHWHIPEAHFLESWGDLKAYDGTVSIVQPLIAPLYDGRSALEVLSALRGEESSGFELVRSYWTQELGADNFEKRWRRALHDGLLADSTPSAVPAPAPTAVGAPPAIAPEAGTLEIVFRPDPCVLDGSYANNGWLQELPKPITKLTWDNAALVSPRTAEQLKLSNDEVVALNYHGQQVQAPVWIVPGQADDSITVHFGYGRTRAGKVAANIGFSAYRLWTSDSPGSGSGLRLEKTGRRHPLACTQHHHSMEGRHLIRQGTVGEYAEHPEFVHEMAHEFSPEETLYPPWKYESYAWGMAIDLNACTGCNACVIACQSENNIPIVGKEQVMNGREMHWLRLDRYFEGSLENPSILYQPMPCQHCENAPCELVCPVAATTHSAEGLNEMTYNRCVGTRYCSNNCPYKVRRFNFLLFQDWETESLRSLRNPDVTVRSRGVMEKCTYCVQRINAARIDARNEDRKIKDGEVRTACQAVCPSNAIVFGDINDPSSEVTSAKASRLNYGILTDLNTRPRTSYLARLKNPNPAIAAAEPATGEHG